MNYAYNEEAMLRGITAFRKETKTPAKMPMLVKPIEEKKPDLIAIAVIEAVANRYELSAANIISPCREDHLVTARQVVALILRRNYSYTLQQIGECMNRHYSSVLHSCRSGSKHYRTNPKYKSLVDGLAGGPLNVERDELGLPVLKEVTV